MAANYLRNRMPCTGNPGAVSPHQMEFGHPPNTSHNRPWGQTVYSHLPHDSRENSRGESLDAAAEVGILVGYQDNGSGYRVFFPDRRGGKGSVLTRRDLKFCKPGTAPPEEGDERFQARRRHEMMTGTCRPTRPPFLLADTGGGLFSPFSGGLPAVLSTSAPVGALGDGDADTNSINYGVYFCGSIRCSNCCNA